MRVPRHGVLRGGELGRLHSSAWRHMRAGLEELHEATRWGSSSARIGKPDAEPLFLRSERVHLASLSAVLTGAGLEVLHAHHIIHGDLKPEVGTYLGFSATSFPASSAGTIAAEELILSRTSSSPLMAAATQC